MSDYDHVGKAADAFVRGYFVLLFVAGPLALWKAIEIVVWLWGHISVKVN